jgi:hypothetical protein
MLRAFHRVRLTRLIEARLGRTAVAALPAYGMADVVQADLARRAANVLRVAALWTVCRRARPARGQERSNEKSST